MEITKKQVLKYAILPGILPRTMEFFTTGFSHVSVFMAQAFRAADLLPFNHPYLNPANFGRFGIRQVLSEGRRHLVFRRENIDQIVVYYAMMAGIFLLFFQFALLTLALTIHSANAAMSPFGAWMGQFFVTPNPAGDIAYILLDRTFGYKGLYGSCVDPGIPCPLNPFTGQPALPLEGGSIAAVPAWPTQFHTGLHWLFAFYDMGVAAVGMIILTYMVATVTAETAHDGVPFGRRFNKAWVVPRLLLTVILLFPWDGPQPVDNTYMNGAQSIVLHVAKWGSSLATNGWITFNNALVSDTLAGPTGNLVVDPNPPAYNNFLEFMLLARTCKYAEERITQEPGQPAITIDAWQVDENDNAWPMPTAGNFNTALTNSQNQDIIIRFGQKSNDYIRDSGHIKPICGQITVKVEDLTSPGSLAVEGAYYDMIYNRWTDPTQDLFAQQIVQRFTPVPDKDPMAAVPDAAFLQNSKVWMDNAISAAVTAGRNAAILDPAWIGNYLILGWGGAAIWYDKLAQINGSFVDAVFNLPQPDLYPEVLEYVKLQRKAHDSDDSGEERFKPIQADGTPIFWRKPAEDNIALCLYYVQHLWKDQYQTKTTGNTLSDYIKAVFGLQGLFNMLDNVSTNPLAQLVGLGRSLIQAAAIQLGGRLLFGALGGALGKIFGPDVKITADFLGDIAFLTLSIGIMLYYVLPFMPFVYFFFAVGAWVKAVFEAMVGMPLWALSFARIDGDGLPGKSGMNGFYLLLEILLRPILIIFGLIASISIFCAQVVVMHSVWNLVITNIGGADTVNAAAGTANLAGGTDFVRDYIDAFCYTIMYTVVVYMIGMSSFKLIDIFPKRILRWMGQSVNVFSSEGDAGKELLGTSFEMIQTGAAGLNKGLFTLFSRNSVPTK